jgi:hypothetical protein
MLYLDVSVNKNFCAAPGVSVYKNFGAAPGVSVYKSLCCTDACPTSRPFVLHLKVSVFKSAVLVSVCLLYKSFVLLLHLYVSACKSPTHAVSGTSVCFETCIFVSVNSIHVRNTETNRKNIIICFHETNRKTTKTDRVSVLFGSN